MIVYCHKCGMVMMDCECREGVSAMKVKSGVKAGDMDWEVDVSSTTSKGTVPPIG